MPSLRTARVLLILAVNGFSNSQSGRNWNANMFSDHRERRNLAATIRPRRFCHGNSGSVEGHASTSEWSESGNRGVDGSRLRLSAAGNRKSVKPATRGAGANGAAREEQAGQRGRKWIHTEDAQVCEEGRSGTDFHEIAKTHNRSVGSIVARLVKLGKIAAPPAKAA